MKRVICLLIFTLIFNSCDDGNLIQEDITFEDTTTQSCGSNNVIYKINGNEALLLEIPKTSFVNEPNTIEININSTNRVVYRFYNGPVAAENICETIPPATPIVNSQWTATAGTIQITTTTIKSTNTTDNSTKITGYNHNIVFKNITFAKENGTQVYETFPFGDYTTTATALAFNFDQTVEKCANSNDVYNYTTSEALILTIDPTLLLNEVTAANAPRKGLIGSTKNILTYRLFSDLLTGSYFCNATTPATPAVQQEWTGVDGITDVSGIVEVTTTTSGPNTYKHTITLKKVTFKRGNSNFLLGDNYIYGDLFTSN
jgi:PBP1b-binding outer membrane lipoprotein LpoB